MRRGEKLKFILESLQETVSTGTDLLAAFLAAGYGASRNSMLYHVNKIGRRRRLVKKQVAATRIERQRYFSLIYALKKDGLLLETEKNGNKILNLTLRGKQRLALLRTQEKKQFPEPRYQAQKHDLLTIITFDIPESESKKRAWLRYALKRMGFAILQKSVWIGKVKLPLVFLEDLKVMKLGGFVEIFEVTKSGSLRNIH